MGYSISANKKTRFFVKNVIFFHGVMFCACFLGVEHAEEGVEKCDHVQKIKKGAKRGLELDDWVSLVLARGLGGVLRWA